MITSWQTLVVVLIVVGAILYLLRPLLWKSKKGPGKRSYCSSGSACQMKKKWPNSSD